MFPLSSTGIWFLRFAHPRHTLVHSPEDTCPGRVAQTAISSAVEQLSSTGFICASSSTGLKNRKKGADG